MKLSLHALVALLISAMMLAACGSAPAVEAPAPVAPTTELAPEPTIAPLPSPTFEAVSAVEPTAVPVAASTAAGILDWRDNVLRSDGVVLSANGLPVLPAGEVYVAWLGTSEGSLPLGALRQDGEQATLSYDAADQANLLAAFDRAYVTSTAQADATETPGDVLLSGVLPPAALIHIRHVLSGIGITPNGVGFAVGLRAETDELLRHAQFLRDAQNAGDLPLVRVHAEHLINIIRDSEARDANGDGEIQNPGDGYGLLPNGAQDGYIKGVVDHAALAADAADATANIRVHSEHVQIAGENTRVRADEIRGLAERIVSATSLDGTGSDVLALLALAEQTIQGVDLDRDEQIEPVPGEGGVITAYQHAQLMAAIELLPADDTLPAPVAAVPAGTPEAAAPTADHNNHGGNAAPGAATVTLGDNTFTPNQLSVAAGTTVTWTNAGQRPHTVTAEDGSFNSGTLNSGDTFSVNFDTPGTYRYICEFHNGMEVVIIVTEAASAAPAPAPTSAPAPAPAAPVEVAMLDFEFAPLEIRIKVGAAITWRNDGEKQHSATAVDGSFDTGLYGAGESRSVTFNTPGTFLYFCQLHATPDGTQGMVGTVIVE